MRHGALRIPCHGCFLIAFLLKPLSSKPGTSLRPCPQGLRKKKGEIHLLKLKEIRLRAGLTQVQLAERLGVPQTTLSKWECGSSPNCDMIRRVAAELRCTTDELLGVEKEGA